MPERLRRGRIGHDAGERQGSPGVETSAIRRRGLTPVLRDLRVALGDIVVVILILAATFDGLSGNWIHSILLYSAAVALGRDAIRTRGGGSVETAEAIARPEPTQPLASAHDDPRTKARRLVFVPLGLLAIVIYGVVVGGFARYSWATTAVVVVPGAIVLAASWNGPLTPRPAPGPIGTVGAVAWLAVFIPLGLWELTQLLLQPNLTTDSWAHPTLSVLTDPILASHPGRALGLMVWLLFGWFLLDR